MSVEVSCGGYEGVCVCVRACVCGNANLTDTHHQPDITFFGEKLPASFHDRLVEHDRDKCDLLICIGTSLKVAPVSEIISFLPPDVPQIYISKTVSTPPSRVLKTKANSV